MACFLLIRADNLSKESHFSRFDLSMEGKILQIIPSDLNGDSLKDLIVIYRTGYSFNIERWLAVFFQTSHGRFNSSPDRVWKIPENSSIIDVCNIDEAADEEIIFLTTNGVSYYKGISVKVPPQLKRLLDVSSIAKVAAKKEISQLDFCKDWLGKEKSEFLIPGFTFTTFVDSRLLDEITSGEPSVRKSGFSKDIEHWPDELHQKLDIPSFASYSPGSHGSLFSSFAFPDIFSLDENGDQLKDIIALREDRLFIFHQTQDHKLPTSPSKVIDLNILTPEEKASDQTYFSVTLDDLNGDNIADAYVWKMRTEGFANFVGDVRIFFGKKETGLSKNPDLILTIPDGYYVLTGARDHDGDGKKEISIFSIKLGLWGYVKMFVTHKIKVYINIFIPDKNGNYPSVPSLSESYSIRIDLSRGFDIPAYRVADLNGDRILDLIFGTEKDEISIFIGTGMKDNKIYSKEASDIFSVDPHPRVVVDSLENDEFNDIAFYYPLGEQSKGKIILMKNNRIW